MTVEIYLWNPQTQTQTLVQTVNNVTSQQTISALCGSVVCTPTPYTDTQREDFGGGMYAQRSANFTLWTLAATAAQGYQFSRFAATWTGEYTYKPYGSDPEVTYPWSPTDSGSFSTPWAAAVTSPPDIAEVYSVDGAYEGTDRWDAFALSASYEIYQTTSLTVRVYFAISTSTLTYDANGGQGAPTSQTYTVGTAFTLSSVVPTRAGHRFLGWGDSASDLTASYQPGQAVTFSVHSKTIYALWRIHTGLLIRNGAGTGLLRGDTTPLPLVDA